MSKFNLVTIRPKGFLHSDASRDVRDSLAWSLTALGHEVVVSESAFAHGPVTNIVFCSELLPPGSVLPTECILYNLEQPSHPSMENIRKLGRDHTVWDYSEANVRDWQKLGIPARHLPIGYTPNLTRVPRAATQDIDVCFLGWLTPRRKQLINDLIAAGLKVYASDCCYGGARDQILSRSKVCLNINHDGRTLFNIVRCSFLWANHKLVLSETSTDCEPWVVQSCAWAEYDNLVHTCQCLLEDERIRESRTKSSFQLFSQHDYTESVRQVLEPSSVVPVKCPIEERYARGCREGDMKDFLPTLRSLAKGQILEIGVRDGASTSAFLLGLEERGGKLVSIDINDCGDLWKHPQWAFLEGDSHSVKFDESRFDLALIDGDHSPQGFLADLTNCLRWVKPGGLILCHDIAPLPNYTQEAAGGDWPSQYVGEQFFAIVKEKKLRSFVYPGAWGLGCIIND